MSTIVAPTFDAPSTLPALSDAELDELDFGVVRVDDDGVITFYNEYESDLANVDPEDAVGKNFFTQIAPCTNNRLFFGRFKEGVAEGALDVAFPYTFTYKLRPMLVDIRLYRSPEDGSNWVLVKKQ